MVFDFSDDKQYQDYKDWTVVSFAKLTVAYPLGDNEYFLKEYERLEEVAIRRGMSVTEVIAWAENISAKFNK